MFVDEKNVIRLFKQFINFVMLRILIIFQRWNKRKVELN